MTTSENSGEPSRRARRRVVLATALAVAVAAAGVGLVVALRGGGGSPAPLPTAGSASSTAASASPRVSTSAGPRGTAFPYQPLWPFRDGAEAQRWQAGPRVGGGQDWHLDAGATALAFTRGYLGFTDIQKVVASAVNAGDATVSVGTRLDNGRDATAAVLHLARLGSGQDAPWEVVGTEDATLSVTRPAYGSVVTSPVTVGGRITGVDESLRVQVRQSSSTGPIGEACCLPAGGENTPWSMPVTFGGVLDPVATIVVSTGGHVSAVERFAVTGVRVSTATPAASPAAR